MKALLISDLHFGSNQNNHRFLEAQIGLFKNQIIPTMKEQGIKLLFILGDVFHYKEQTDNFVNNEVRKLFTEDLSDFKVIITLGNHDIYFRDSLKYHGLSWFAELPNVEVVSRFCLYDFGGKTIGLTPWIINHEEFLEQLDTSPKLDALFGHFDLIGFSMNKLSETKHGTDPMDFAKYTNSVYSGHYHTPSTRLIGDSCRVVYLGSPYQHTRIDMDDPKGFVILDSETMNFEFVESVGIPKFKVYNSSDKNISESDIRGNFVDIRVPILDADKVKFRKLMEKLESYEPFRIEPKMVGNEGVTENNSEVDMNIDARSLSIIDLISEYVDNELEESDGMKSSIKEDLSVIYTEVSEFEMSETV